MYYSIVRTNVAVTNLSLGCSPLHFRRAEFASMIDQFSITSTAPNWTFVFCSLQTAEMISCGSVVKEKGYTSDVFIWNKPDLSGKSHAGGARQAKTVEYIVVVYKHADASMTGLQNHYSLLVEKEKWVSAAFALVTSLLVCLLLASCIKYFLRRDYLFLFVYYTISIVLYEGDISVTY